MNKENNTKQVVIGTQTCLLSAHWFIEFLKLKGYEKVFLYKGVMDEDFRIIGFEREDGEKGLTSFELTSFDATLMFEYSSVDLGKYLEIEDFEEKIQNSRLLFLDLIKNREDKDLIEIANRIIDEESIRTEIKIIDIPIDVEYDVKEYECASGEYIEEKHRTWD